MTQPGKEAMKSGFQVYDTDTHINPAAEVLDKYVDPDFRPRLPELAPYRSAIGRAVEGASDLHAYRTGTKYLPADPRRGGAARDIHRPGLAVDGQQETATGHPGR